MRYCCGGGGAGVLVAEICGLMVMVGAEVPGATSTTAIPPAITNAVIMPMVFLWVFRGRL